ncbi:hypothetical protein C923_03274 [Plasmodium falciparum UGT5.1]|nr:hypothetical protein PFFVO_03184 [Plasmodium falciparum Vietnam Oak-Knoll (FVO)]ETW31431.1 hypothetical protein PFFCH_01156 [Plasmodium falciparum FCH/4]ETW42323.1 hypothetical protein PFNF135_03333 [Plasmodium falciparum NF135/5.C10]EWC76051.1 hypothetical protein C923_03274 [Plasmodium falciparum UGT5.1]
MNLHNDDNMSDNISLHNDDDQEEEQEYSSNINFKNNIILNDGNDYKEIINNEIYELNNVKEEDECNLIKENYDIQSDDDDNNNININDDHKFYYRHIHSNIKDNEEGSKNILKINEEEYQKKLQNLFINKTVYENQDQRDFTKNENLHDDYYYFKYLNNKENTTDPYHYTKGCKKTNIQVTPSPFPQFLRDIQIYNIPQKKIRLKRTSIPLKKEDDKNKEQKYIYNKTKKKDRKKERSISVVREKVNK